MVSSPIARPRVELLSLREIGTARNLHSLIGTALPITILSSIVVVSARNYLHPFEEARLKSWSAYRDGIAAWRKERQTKCNFPAAPRQPSAIQMSRIVGSLHGRGEKGSARGISNSAINRSRFPDSVQMLHTQ